MQLRLNVIDTVRDRNDRRELQQRLDTALEADKHFGGRSGLVADDVKTLRDEIEHLGRTHPSIW